MILLILAGIPAVFSRTVYRPVFNKSLGGRANACICKGMLLKAKEGKYAVGQFNINNLEWTKAILNTAQACQSPVILGVSEGAAKYMTGYGTVVGMVNGMLKSLNITVPVALHLDHGEYTGALACIEAGFSSVMFDGSHYPIDENIEKTKEIIRKAAEKGVSVEAEVGAIGGERMESLAAVKRRILPNVPKLRRWESICWLLVSVISMVRIRPTGPAWILMCWLRCRRFPEVSRWCCMAVQVFLRR